VTGLHDKCPVPDGESRHPPQAVHATAVVNVLGLMRLGGQFSQRRPRAVRPQIAALLHGHHFGGEYAAVLRRSDVGIRVLDAASVTYPRRHATESDTSTLV